MRCAWEAYLSILPQWMRKSVDEQAKDDLQEIHLRINYPPELCTAGRTILLNQPVTGGDIRFCINVASQYSPWAAKTVTSGYLTADGGHRIGICGQVVSDGKEQKCVTQPYSLCIRVARDFPGIAEKLRDISGSLLIVGRPGSGKTTLLRDLIRQRSKTENIAVVDERRELFPFYRSEPCFPPGCRTDILSGGEKGSSVEAVLRSMSPGTIAVDEITGAEDTASLMQAGWCGVSLFATAHAASVSDLTRREIYRPLVKSRLFENVVVLQKDKSWHLERIPYDY